MPARLPVLFLATLITEFLATLSAAKQQPNIIYILLDDAGYGDLS